MAVAGQPTGQATLPNLACRYRPRLSIHSATHKLLGCPMQSPISAGEAKSRNFKCDATPIGVGAPARPNACISAARRLARHVVGGVKRPGVYPSQHDRTKHHPVSGSVSIAVLAVFVWRGGHVAATVASRLECLSPG